jgi:hypothetical protein
MPLDCGDLFESQALPKKLHDTVSFPVDYIGDSFCFLNACGSPIRCGPEISQTAVSAAPAQSKENIENAATGAKSSVRNKCPAVKS